MGRRRENTKIDSFPSIGHDVNTKQHTHIFTQKKCEKNSLGLVAASAVEEEKFVIF
jgi:hypothetical protein